MFITITSGKVPSELSEKLEKFLQELLPKMRQLPGVRAIYHYSKPEAGEVKTIVIWEDEESIKAYREGELIKEAIAFEKENNLSSTREIYPLTFSLGDNIIS